MKKDSKNKKKKISSEDINSVIIKNSVYGFFKLSFLMQDLFIENLFLKYENDKLKNKEGS